MATRIKTVTVKAGNYMRIHVFPVRNVHAGRRQKKFSPSSGAQERYNAKMAAYRFADLLHVNFTEEDFAMRLSYTGECPDLCDAKKAFANFIRRMKYAYARRGVEFRAMWATHRGKNGSRIHHHLVVTGCDGVTNDQRFLRDLWNNGGRGGETSYVYLAPLEFDIGDEGGYRDGGLTGLAKYYIFDNDEAHERVGEQWYGRTRNLRLPEVREQIGAMTVAEAGELHRTGTSAALAQIAPGYTVRGIAEERVADAEADEIGCKFDLSLFTTVFLEREREGAKKCRKKFGHSR